MYKQLLATIVFGVSTLAGAQSLHVYGAGGPLAPLKECAEAFTNQTQVSVEVTAGPESKWFAKAQGDADVVYGGAEYMLTQFDQQHPGFLQLGSRSELYRRAIGILVRKHNPKHIHVLADLTKPGIKILDVNGAGQLGVWEDLAGRQGLIASMQEHIGVSVENSAQGIKQWNEDPTLDAWITYASWQKRLVETTDLIALPPNNSLYRGTPIAIASRSTQRAAAAAFIQFLYSAQAHAIFVKWGWK